MYFIYFLQSIRNGKIYVGMTGKSPEERLSEHNIGSNKWTKENGPFELLYYEKYYCKKDLVAREKFYKSGFGRKVRDIILKTLDNKLGA